MASTIKTAPKFDKNEIVYVPYDRKQEPAQLDAIRTLISKDLSEPYSIYVYRYFLYQWGELCFLAMHKDKFIGVVVSKLERHRQTALRGYIAMLAVEKEYRGMGIATKLVRMTIDAMVARNAEEVALETETTNTAAMKLYEGLGFIRSKRLHRYYLNGSSAFRLILYIQSHQPPGCGGCCGHGEGDEHVHAHEHGHDHQHSCETQQVQSGSSALQEVS